MNVYHLRLANPGLEVSGGLVADAELIRSLMASGVANVVVTTRSARLVFERMGLAEDQLLRFVEVAECRPPVYRFRLFLSYVRTLASFLSLRESICEDVDGTSDALFCNCPFFPSAVAFASLRRRFGARCFFWYHMQSPPLLYGYRCAPAGGRPHLPPMALVHFKLNDLLARVLLRDSNVIVDNPGYRRLFRDGRTTLIPLGASVPEPPHPRAEPDYHAVFMARFHPQKGLSELPAIAGAMKSAIGDVRVLVIGDGDRQTRGRFLFELAERGLGPNIDNVGFVYGAERFEYLRGARVFLCPSFYEGFGLSALEAMACGLPVVAYDLPVFRVFDEGVVTVPVGDIEAFAREALHLLSDEDHYREVSEGALRCASRFTWEKTAAAFLDLVSGS